MQFDLLYHLSFHISIYIFSDRNPTSYSTNIAAHLALHDNEELTSLIKVRKCP